MSPKSKRNTLHLNNIQGFMSLDQKCCETASNVVFVLNSAFTSKDQYFQAALHEDSNAFNEMLHSFGYTQKLEHYDPHQHQAHPPQQHPLYN